MANAQHSTDYYEYATVDTAPGSAGYGTNEINIRSLLSRDTVFFSYDGGGVMTVTLQFKRAVDSDWIDYDTYTIVTMEELAGGGAGVLWRAIVKDGDYSSGAGIFGFDW